MLTDKHYKILFLLFTIIIIALLIKAFTNQGRLWGNEYYQFFSHCCTNECSKDKNNPICIFCNKSLVGTNISCPPL